MFHKKKKKKIPVPIELGHKFWQEPIWRLAVRQRCPPIMAFTFLFNTAQKGGEGGGG